jgi:hypothetical protein
VETFAEIRCSGELCVNGLILFSCANNIIRAKYGLATTHAIMTVFRDNQTIGSDIGCSFMATVSSSSLGPAAKKQNLKFVVNAFHGYMHNRECQLAFHPLYTPRLGLEDLETCERIFSASNAVASTIWYASYFHWIQSIDLHFDQWDRNKCFVSIFINSNVFASLNRAAAKFLYNNYKQALSFIRNFTPEVDNFKCTFGYSDDDFQNWRLEEQDYLLGLDHEPECGALAISYVECLQELAKAQCVFADSSQSH